MFYLKPMTSRVYRFFEYIPQISNWLLPNNRTADHVFTLRTLINKYVHNHNKKIYASFVDFKKAFDSVWHDGLLNKLLQINVGGCFYNLIKNIYHNSSCSLKIAKTNAIIPLYKRCAARLYLKSIAF